jgi:glycogen debranching enzyme
MLEKESQPAQAADDHEAAAAAGISEPEIIRVPAAPSVTRSIADKVAIKDGDLFFLTNRDGNVPLTRNHGFGLYYHDCRYLNGYELKLAGTTYTSLAATAEHDFMAIFQFANSDIIIRGRRMILAERLSVEWERLIDSPSLALRDVLTFHNYEFNQEIEFPVSLTLRSDFEDIFVVRGMLPPQMGEIHEPIWQDGVLSLVYHGADNRYRSLSVHFLPAPTATNGTTATFQMKLQPQESKQVKITLVVAESTDLAQVQPKPLPEPNLKQYKAWLHRLSNEWMENQTQVQSDSLLLNKIMYRSLRDLHMMKNTIDNYEYFSCGLPWFNTVFGRDNLVIAIQTLAYDPKAAEQVLRILAHYQGKRVDPWRDEQPGKILHELRVGELTNLNVLPYSP